MNYKQLRELITDEIKKYEGHLMTHSNDLADNPEVSSEEYESSRKIVELLNHYGYRCEYPFMEIETAFRGIYGENNHKYKIALLTEYDALPEIGHACGHCLSGSISLLAGIATKDLQEELNADIHIIGTPAEETDGKKCYMADQGLFDNYDFAIMVHLNNQSLVRPKLQCLSGTMYNFKGKAAHASAAPWEGRNAFNAAQLFFHAIDMLRQHTFPETQFHGIIHKGGEAPNIVPEHVLVEQYVRALDRDYMYNVQDMVDKCAEGACIATGTTWDKYKKDADFYNLKSNNTVEKVIEEVYGELGIELNGDPDLVFGSSDVGNVSYCCPGFQPCLQIADLDTPIHTRGFAENIKSERAHQGLIDGAKIIAFSIAKIFSDEENIKAMKVDFEGKANV